MSDPVAPEGVSTADDAPLPGHDPNAPVEKAADAPPILPEVGSNYMPAPIAPGNPVVEPDEPIAEPAPAEDASVESAPPAHGAEAHDQHGAQAEANVSAHAHDHDAKPPLPSVE